MFTNKARTYVAFLCLCVALLPDSVLASSTISNNNEDRFMQEMEKVMEVLHQSNSKNPVNPNNLVLFLGPTGAGKSTTICALLLGKLDKIKKFKNFEGQRIPAGYYIDIKDDKGKKHPKIGHKDAESCTVFPACYPLKGHDLDLCDFPGLFDPGGLEKRTAIAITSRLFLEKAKQVKAVVLVMSQSDLEAGFGCIIKQVIYGLTKMFANPIDHANSIFFALTKSNYSPGIFRYRIRGIMDNINEKRDNAGTSNSKSLYHLLDTMLTKHQENFLVVNPLEEKSSKLIIARLKQSKGFPAKAIRFIGDEETNRASRRFFTKCAKEGIEILDICNTYPKEIKEKTKEILDLDFKILEAAQAIQEHEKNKKNTFENLLKGLKSDMVQAKADITSLREEKSAKEKYIRNHDTSTLVKVGSKILSKEEMDFKDPWFEYDYRIKDISVISDNGSYCSVKLDFDSKNGYIVKESRLHNTYKATYRCYEDGGSGLTVTLLERSRIRYSREISKARERVKKLTATEIPDKKNAIAVLKKKVLLVEQFLVTHKDPPKFDLVKQLEARKERKAKELSSLQKALKEMKKKLLYAEKELCRKRKLFDITASTHRLLGFTYGRIAYFTKEYRIRGRLLTSGYIRRYTKGFPKELFNIVLRNLDFI